MTKRKIAMVPQNMPMTPTTWIEMEVERFIQEKHGMDSRKFIEAKDQLNSKMLSKLVDVVTVVYENGEIFLCDLQFELNKLINRNSNNIINFEINGESVEANIKLSSYGKFVSIEHSSKMNLIFVLTDWE